jgi:hypothetical protein
MTEGGSGERENSSFFDATKVVSVLTGFPATPFVRSP